MREIRLEPMLVPQALGHRVEHRGPDLRLLAAHAADEVAVGVTVGPVPASDTVVEVGVRDETELVERLQIPIDGRWSDRRESGAHAPRDLVGGDVMPRPLDRVEHELPLQGQSPATRPDGVRKGHDAIVTR